MAEKPRNAMYCIPDDQDASTYRFIIVAAKRARQLQNGQRSVLPATNKKPTMLAMEEVRRGLVPYDDLARPEFSDPDFPGKEFSGPDLSGDNEPSAPAE